MTRSQFQELSTDVFDGPAPALPLPILPPDPDPDGPFPIPIPPYPPLALLSPPPDPDPYPYALKLYPPAAELTLVDAGETGLLSERSRRLLKGWGWG